MPLSIAGDPQSGLVGRFDIVVEDGVIAALAPASPHRGSGTVFDLDGGLVVPTFVDMHTHLDKGHIWPRQENPDGTWFGALTAVIADRDSRWSAADMARRMDFALRCAYAHGTAAIRTHLDGTPALYDITWQTFEEMRARWADRVEIQGVTLVAPDDLLDKPFLDAIAKRTKQGGGILGGSVAVHPEARQAIFNVVEKAGELDLELDLHIDETGDPNSMALRHLADAVIETGYDGRVTAGHCCVISVQDEAVAQATIDRAAEAGISVVSLPMCNMYLQDRRLPDNPHRTPIWRGPTQVHELRAAGVPVVIASDNTRDPFYAYGDLDMLEVFREGARILHYDHPQVEAWRWLRIVTADAAAMGGFDYAGELRIGAGADLVLFGARSWTELHARPQADRIVLRKGVAIDTTLPDYRELDDLMET